MYFCSRCFLRKEKISNIKNLEKKLLISIYFIDSRFHIIFFFAFENGTQKWNSEMELRKEITDKHLLH